MQQTAIRTLVLALALTAAGVGAHAQTATAPRGHLVIVGGGPRPASVMERFVALAGGPKRARIVVIPNASGDVETAEGRKAAAEAGDDFVAEMRKAGVEATSVLLTRAEAEDPASAKLLDGATGVFFTGGQQDRLTRALKGTPVEAKLHALYDGGAVISGTSAGAAVMSEVMLTGDERHPGGVDRPDTTLSYVTIARENVVTAPGFGFVRNAIVDQHFVRRKRLNRLLSLVLEHPALLGVGIDESTALEVAPDGRWTVLGNSIAVVYDARGARITAPGAVLGATPLRLSILPAGSVFDPRTGEATLPSAPARAGR
ncbi:MAG TPA: cyanophycinase [Longimicrobiales bacterium]|nr:cyanophycinase [Longimicrobiales bacterium]